MKLEFSFPVPSFLAKLLRPNLADRAAAHGSAKQTTTRLGGVLETATSISKSRPDPSPPARW